MLPEIDFRIEYSSDKNDLIKDFYVPCFLSACQYDRAVGYFTSNGLKVVAQGLSIFLEKKAQIRLVASPVLSEKDISSINDGYKSRDEVISQSFSETIAETNTEHLNLLAWLIAKKILDIKLAIRVSNNGLISSGIFHEKYGYFKDIEGNVVAFSGSSNETQGGLVDNQESFDVYWSWDDPHNRVQSKTLKFEKLWNDETNRTRVFNFTEQIEHILKAYKTKNIPKIWLGLNRYGKKNIGIPEDIKLRDYQKDVINDWFSKKGRGVAQLATGTGKTITAISAAVTLFKKAGLKSLVVVCPYKHLVKQWDTECRKFGLSPILAYLSSAQWNEKVNNALVYDNVSTGLIVIITTITTFSDRNFQAKIPLLPTETMLIGDEVHNFGAKKISNSLPDIKYRIGLSATPERWLDTEGTKRIFNYFGEILKPKLTLKDALDLKVLTPYNYYPVLVTLEDDELEEYYELSEKIGKMIAMGNSIEDDDSPLMKIMIKRARLIMSARGKLIALKEILTKIENPTKMLIYCGDGCVDVSGSIEEKRQIDEVTKIVGSDLGIKVAQYTAETLADEREYLTLSLASGELQGLVAIKCLDEGVDIPAIHTAIILASSTNPRQFIQRRGRVLRRSEGKSSAEIYDMIVVSPLEDEVNEYDRNLMKKELTRFVEFADLAKNNGYARKQLVEIQKHYDLLDL